MTGYVLLGRVADGDWQEMGTMEAHSALAAVRDYAALAETLDGLTIVAVPVRSWKPRAVSVETTRRVKIG